MSFPPPTERQAQILWSALTALGLGVIASVLILFLWAAGKVLGVLSPVLVPLAVAGALAYLLDPVVDFIQERGVPRTRAIVCVFAMAVMVFLGVGGSIVPQIIVETKNLVDNIPTYSTALQGRIETWVTKHQATLDGWFRFLRGTGAPSGSNAPPARVQGPNEMVGRGQGAPLAGTTNSPPATATSAEAEGTVGSADEPPGSTAYTQDSGQGSILQRAIEGGRFRSATDWVVNLFPRAGRWLFGQVTRVVSWFGVIAGLALVPVYLFYFLLEKKGIENRWTFYLPVRDSATKTELVFVLKSINDYLIVFFRSQVLVAICDGILYTIGFSLIGLPYAVLLGAVAIMLTMVPFLGAAVTCGTALIIAIVQFGDWTHPLLVCVVFGIVQFLEGFIIAPKIIGDRVGLHPLTIIIAVMVGTTVMGGLIGAILAIPLTAALRVLMFRYVWRKPDPASEETQAPQPAG